MPRSLINTSTHDSKRGEDVRARLNVLSEIPREWRAAVRRWSRLNKDRKVALVGNEVAPDGNDEYLIYQTLLGTYPAQAMEKEEAGAYRERIQQYMLKAIREAKVHTSWINPDPDYEEGVANFVRDLLDPATSGGFLADFPAFLEPVAVCGIYNSLSQLVLKLFSPGVPDIYQGNELWSFNLTDPDNRRPVDFGTRIQLLGRIKEQTASAQDLSDFTRRLVEGKKDGTIKLYVTWASLNYRREHVGLFDTGRYVPLKVSGAKRDHVCAFAWQNANLTLIVAVPRLVAGLTRLAAVEPLGPEVWGDTRIVLPRKFEESAYKNIFTGEKLETVNQAGRLSLHVADILATFPVAGMESETA
jgi:(1->4)-alpha-D-glucan 1-alpha-D-glucosylmutase